MPALKTLILGAGPGGLALAQMLRAQNLPFEIFERDSSASSRQQGWAVALVECLPDLEALLPPDLGDLHATSVNDGLAPYDAIGLLDADTGAMLGGLGAVPRGQEGYMLRANRHRFREFLFKGIDIRFGKTFARYAEDAAGVTVFFEDGSCATGDIVVGADGAHSRVRRQLLGPEASVLVPSVYVPIIQEMTVPKDVYGAVHAFGTSAAIAGREGLRFLVGMLAAAPSGATARYYTATCFKSAAPEADADWVRDAAPAARLARVEKETRGLPSMLTALVAHGGEDGFRGPQTRFAEFVTPTALPEGRVTLLGDAAHTMVPFRGAGANTAVADAVSLVRALLRRGARGEDGKGGVDEVLAEYHGILLPRGRKMVLTSREAGEDLLGPLVGRVNNLGHVASGGHE